jgi:hypothetical protein
MTAANKDKEDKDKDIQIPESKLPETVIAYQRFTDLGLAGGGVGGGKKDKKNAGEEMRDCLAMIDTVKVVRNHGSRLCN